MENLSRQAALKLVNPKAVFFLRPYGTFQLTLRVTEYEELDLTAFVDDLMLLGTWDSDAEKTFGSKSFGKQ